VATALTACAPQTASAPALSDAQRVWCADNDELSGYRLFRFSIGEVYDAAEELGILPANLTWDGDVIDGVPEFDAQGNFNPKFDQRISQNIAAWRLSDAYAQACQSAYFYADL